MKSAAIVLAAGSGKRMGSEIPKQFLLLKEKPLLYYSLKAFQESNVDEIILVTTEADISYCKDEIVEKYHFDKVTQIVSGGEQRYDSVYAGLTALANVDYVQIHDGARPLVAVSVINSLLDIVIKEKACVTAVPVKDTIKVADEDNYAIETPNRSTLWTIQTPQVFEYSLIKKAYDEIYDCSKSKDEQLELQKNITDDAQLIETFTEQRVRLIEGEYTNIKVTTPEDMTIAEAFLRG